MDKEKILKQKQILERMRHLQELPKLAKDDYAAYVEFTHGA
jgi:hypothetical protein